MISKSFADIFKFSLAVIKGKKSLAIALLLCLENQGESPLKVLGILSWQFRVILKLVIFLRKGYLLNNIFKRINFYGHCIK